MKSKTIIIVLVTASALAASGYGLYRAGMNRGMNQIPPNVAEPAEKKVLYWHDPMVPGHKFDKPGKSPFMDMQLVPAYADDGSDEGTINISSRIQQNLGIRTAEATAGSMAAAFEAIGSVAYNERDVELVQARSNGFVEQLFVRAPLDSVRKGQAMAELYVPDWIAAQEEYLTVKRMSGSGTEGLLDAARQRMRLAGMTDDLIRQIEASGKTQPRLTIVAPIGGVVTELSVREGMTVMLGAPLFRINGVGTVWVNAEVPENFAAQLRSGRAVEGRSPALPGVVLKGKVNAILSEISAETRTLKARIELSNPGNRLVPGMFVTVSFSSSVRKDVLMVPSEAVIQTGTRSIVIVEQGDGKFSPTEIEAGVEANGQTEIRKGLVVGQRVVVSGQFLIDSEASLKGTATRMGDESKASMQESTQPQKPQQPDHHHTGATK